MDFVLKKKKSNNYLQNAICIVLFYASVQMLGNNRFKFLQEVRGEGLR